jgi:NADPH:quinone reductase
MSPPIPKTMKAAVIDKFGGPEMIHQATIPVPSVEDWDVLVQVVTAGIGSWTPWIMEGGMTDIKKFPLVLGSDGAGIVVAIGPRVKQFKVGDKVYGYSLGNSKGGFFAEYCSIREENLAPVPMNVGIEEAGALAVSGVTALIGLEKLDLINEQKLAIFGASGGVGHVAVQLAKMMGAEVLAVASGRDGVDLVKRLGADVAIDGRVSDIGKAADEFAPEGLDSVIAFAGGPELDLILERIKEGGKCAYPNGVEPEPKVRNGVEISAYDGLSRPDVYEHLNELIATGDFHVEISKTYSMDEMSQAIIDIQKHHIGKLALDVGKVGRTKVLEKVRAASR